MVDDDRTSHGPAERRCQRCVPALARGLKKTRKFFARLFTGSSSHVQPEQQRRPLQTIEPRTEAISARNGRDELEPRAADATPTGVDASMELNDAAAVVAVGVQQQSEGTHRSSDDLDGAVVTGREPVDDRTIPLDCTPSESQETAADVQRIYEGSDKQTVDENSATVCAIRNSPLLTEEPLTKSDFIFLFKIFFFKYPTQCEIVKFTTRIDRLHGPVQVVVG